MERKVRRRINKEEILELFENFLVENNAYSQYITYIHEECHITLTDLFDFCKRYYSYAEESLPYAFVHIIYFNRTKEGFEFWLNLHLKWNKTFNQYLQSFS